MLTIELIDLSVTSVDTKFKYSKCCAFAINANPLSKLGIDKNKYFLISLHREENVDTKENLMQIMIT